MSKIGIGIIGLDHWYWALGSAYDISINPNAQLVAISDPNEEYVKKIAKIYGAETYYTDYHKLLENPKIDGIIITTTTSMHRDVAVAAAKAGKDILIGKPIARTLKEAREIIDSAKNAGVKLMAMAAGVLPGDPIKRLIDNGVIGEPFAASASLFAILPLGEPGVLEPGWFVDPNKAAGGGFIDHAVYLAAQLRGYFNSEVKRVYAEIGKFIHKRYSVEDYGIAVLRFENNSIATIESTFTAPVSSHNFMRIIGTEGEIEVSGNIISIWSKKEPYNQKTCIETSPPNPVFDRSYVEKPVPLPPFANVYKPTVDEFIKCIHENRQPAVTGEDAYKVLEVCLAAYESIKERKPIQLPLEKETDVPEILKNCL